MLKTVDTFSFKDLYSFKYLNKLNFKQKSLFFIIFKNNFIFYRLVFFFVLNKYNNLKINILFSTENNLTYNYNSYTKNYNLFSFFFNPLESNFKGKSIDNSNNSLKQSFLFKNFLTSLNIINAKKTINLPSFNIYQVKYSVSDFFKNLNGTTLGYINILFLRKNKVFNKGRYSRNRQYYRTGVY